jgi:F420-non-reducing hydrogenase small subunit
LGPTPEVTDQGAKMISAIGSILKIDEEKKLSDEDVQKLTDKIKDPIGTFYMYGFSSALINKKISH